MADSVGVMPPPPGVTPDFDYSDPLLYETNSIIIMVGLVISTSFLAIRIYTNAFVLRKSGWDEVFIVLAWVCAVGTQACSIYGYKHGGIGTHMWNITPEMFNTYLKVVLGAAIIYVAALAFAKISLIILYHRLLNQQGFCRWILHALTGILAGSAFAIILALIFGCDPIQKGWDITITDGKCIDKGALFIATAVMNMFTDIALILLPIPTVASLSIPGIQKIGLLFMFTVGCATVVTSIVRLVTLFPFLNSNDPTYKLGGAQLWVNVEANFIIICSCLPSLRGFLRRYTPKWIGEGSSWGQRSEKHSSIASISRKILNSVSNSHKDNLELSQHPGLTAGGGIRKEVEWEVTAEQRPHPSESAGAEQRENILGILC